MRLARRAFGRARKLRLELSGSEGREGAQAAGEFGISETALAVKETEKVFAGAFAFLGVAFDAGRDEVAMGVAAAVNARDNVIEAPRAGREATETVEAQAALTRMDEFAKRPHFEEVDVLERSAASGGEIVTR